MSELGRPSSYSLEIASEICSQIAAGKSLGSVCRPENMPSVRSVYYWLQMHPDFLQMYTRAKEDQADALAEEMLDIADDGSNDYYEKTLPDGKTFIALDSENINRSRLRVDTRKWIASKLKPKKYGDKLIHSGDADNPLVTKNLFVAVVTNRDGLKDLIGGANKQIEQTTDKN